MAKRLKKHGKVSGTQGKAAAAGSSKKDPAATEAEILHPDGVTRVAGRVITAREYRHYEGQRVLAWAKPFVDDLYAQVALASEPPTLAVIGQLTATHVDMVRDMVAQAITPAPDGDDAAFMEAFEENARWLETLSDLDGDTVKALWWQANAGFFIRRVLARARDELVAKKSATPTSTTS